MGVRFSWGSVRLGFGSDWFPLGFGSVRVRLVRFEFLAFLVFLQLLVIAQLCH